MVMPTQPGNLFSRPFAHSGTYKVIPETKPASGRASLAEGFPTENQLPLSHGGVAPNRMDLNGILNMLSAFAFWQQSGGQWTWSNSLNYTPPALVYHKNGLWWCKAANGPETAAKAVEPGTNGRYWVEFLGHLLDSGSISIANPNPVGSILTYYGTRAPQGYLACDGSAFSASMYPELYAVLGKTTTPDLRGCFIRGYDPNGTVDPNGRTRQIGSVQTDAGRNITGSLTALVHAQSDIKATGAFKFTHQALGENGNRNYYNETPIYDLDASRSWGTSHTANEFRPYNVSLLYCIKHDELD